MRSGEGGRIVWAAGRRRFGPMSLDRRDLEMLTVSIPVVDYWEMREELDRLNDSVDRLERITEALIELYRVERVKNWEMILQEMLEKEETKKGSAGGRIFK
jgi:hypothetical protein